MKTIFFLVLFLLLQPGVGAQQLRELPHSFNDPKMELPSAPQGPQLLNARLKEARFFSQGGNTMVQNMHFRFPGKDTLWVYTEYTNRVTTVYFDKNGDSCVSLETRLQGGISTHTRYRKQQRGILIIEEKTFVNNKIITQRLQLHKDTILLQRQEKLYFEPSTHLLTAHYLEIYQPNGKDIQTEIDSVYSPVLKKLICVKSYEFYPGSMSACKDCKKWNIHGKQVFWLQDQEPEFDKELPQPLHGFSYKYETKSNGISKGSDITLSNTGMPAPDMIPADKMMPEQYKAEADEIRPEYLRNVVLMTDGNWVLADSTVTFLKDGRPLKTIRYQGGQFSREYFYDPAGQRIGVLFTNPLGVKSWDWLRFSDQEGSDIFWLRKQFYVVPDNVDPVIRIHTYYRKNTPQLEISRTYALSEIDTLVQRRMRQFPKTREGILNQRPMEIEFALLSEKKHYRKADRDSVVQLTMKSFYEKTSTHTIRVFNDTFDQTWAWFSNPAKPQLARDTNYNYYFMPSPNRKMLREERRVRSTYEQAREVIFIERTTWNYLPGGVPANMEVLLIYPETGKRQFSKGTETQFIHLKKGSLDTFLCTEEVLFQRFPNRGDSIFSNARYEAAYDQNGKLTDASYRVWGITEQDTLAYERVLISDYTNAENRVLRVERYLFRKGSGISTSFKDQRITMDKKGRALEYRIRNTNNSSAAVDTWTWDAATGLPLSEIKIYPDGRESKQWYLEILR